MVIGGIQWRVTKGCALRTLRTAATKASPSSFVYDAASLGCFAAAAWVGMFAASANRSRSEASSAVRTGNIERGMVRMVCSEVWRRWVALPAPKRQVSSYAGAGALHCARLSVQGVPHNEVGAPPGVVACATVCVHAGTSGPQTDCGPP